MNFLTNNAEIELIEVTMHDREIQDYEKFSERVVDKLCLVSISNPPPSTSPLSKIYECVRKIPEEVE